LTLSSYRSTSASHFVLYGSSDHCLLPSFPTRRSSDLEAVGGLINIITKNPRNSPILAVDAFGTGWGELSADIAAKIQVGNKVQRSEEHTSELQSRENLVCRLLLEKKKNT